MGLWPLLRQCTVVTAPRSAAPSVSDSFVRLLKTQNETGAAEFTLLDGHAAAVGLQDLGGYRQAAPLTRLEGIDAYAALQDLLASVFRYPGTIIVELQHQLLPLVVEPDIDIFQAVFAAVFHDVAGDLQKVVAIAVVEQSRFTLESQY